MLLRFVQIDNHDHASLHRDSKQCDIANPNGHAEVVSERPLKQETSGHCIQRGKNQYGCFGGGLEHQVQQYEDHEENNRENKFQTLLGTKLKLVLPCPAIGVTCR